MDFCVKDVPVSHEYDVLVAGSGMGGISAAVAAAEDGLKVGMIEYFGEPGGIPVNGASVRFPVTAAGELLPSAVSRGSLRMNCSGAARRLNRAAEAIST